MSKEICECGSGAPRSACCGPYLDGLAAAPDAVALMRSRYSAYAEGNAAYLSRTWHPDTRPAHIEATADGVRWRGLRVEASGAEGDEAWVTFTAQLLQNGQPGSLREHSRFRRAADGCWYYVDGAIPDSPVRSARIGRNEPCPCGSGKKYKRCCGA